MGVQQARDEAGEGGGVGGADGITTRAGPPWRGGRVEEDGGRQEGGGFDEVRAAGAVHPGGDAGDGEGFLVLLREGLVVGGGGVVVGVELGADGEEVVAGAPGGEDVLDHLGRILLASRL